MVLMLILEVMAIGTLTVCAFVLLFQMTHKRRSGFYMNRDWNYYIKYYWAKWRLKSMQRNPFEYTADLYLLGKETSSDHQHKSSTDLFLGCDQFGNSLLLKMVKRKNHSTEIWIILRLNGRTFVFPEYPDTIIPESCQPKNMAQNKKKSAGGLEFECLHELKSWRIIYSGPVWELNSSDYGDKKLIFLKLNFFWSAAAPPTHYPHDWSLNLRADALAREPWRSRDWIKYLPTPAFGGYDQFGSLFGQVHIEKEPTTEESDRNQLDDVPKMETIVLNLPGVRQKRFSETELKTGRRSVTFYGVCSDGSVYILGADSYMQNMSQVDFGVIRTPNGDVFPIESTDFKLKHLLEHPLSVVPRVHSIQFKAGNKTYQTSLYFRSKRIIYLNDTAPQRGRSEIIPMEMGLNRYNGTGVCILWYHNTLPDVSDKIHFVLDRKPIKPLQYCDIEPNADNLAYHFADEAASSLQCAGGKGASLSLMTRAMTNGKQWEFKVPAGYVLSVSALERQVQFDRNLRESIEALENVAYEGDLKDLKEYCQKTVDAFQRAPLEPRIIEIVSKYYTELESIYASEFNNDNNQFRVAVRSSAAGEDTDDASSAGQNTTILGVRSQATLIESIKQCWASLFSYQSVEYRRQHGQQINCRMSVVVQIMIPSECSGVMFTRHPMNGDSSKILITSNYGIGETVVSGSVDPDVYIVRRQYKSNDLKLVYSKIGTKSHKLEMSATVAGDKMTEMIELNETERLANSLNEDAILKLGRIGISLEKLFGSSRDIEWAIYKDEVYLLQSRPITTINTWSNWELEHEFDSPVMSFDDVITFANVGEVLPELTTPLTQSILIELLNRCTGQMLLHRKIGIFDGKFAQFFKTHSHRVCVDVFNVFLRIVNEELNLSTRIASLTVFGYDFFTKDIHKIAVHRHGVASGWKILKQILTTIRVILLTKFQVWKIRRILKKNVGGKFYAEYMEKWANHPGIFNSVIDFDLKFKEDNQQAALMAHNYTSQVSTIAQMSILMTLIGGNEELTNSHYVDIATMLNSCKNIESAEIPKMIEQISNEIKAENQSDSFIQISAQDGRTWLRKNCPTASKLFETFIDANYHRAYKELDLGTETWGIRPDIVIDMIQQSLRKSNEMRIEREIVADTENRLSDKEIIDQLKTPLKPITKFLLRLMMPLCKSAIRLREETKSGCLAYLHEIRLAYRFLAKSMYRKGIIPNENLIFYMTQQEITELCRQHLDQQNSLILHKAMRRQKLFKIWKRDRYSEVANDIPRPIQEGDFIPEDIDEFGVCLTGVPVYEGCVRGRACVITSFEDVSKIQAGDILITYSTDVGWSPYFPILSGIVTELGGLLSHGAVVAREYGLPCLIGAVGATWTIQHGEMITLDATKGVIMKTLDSQGETQ